MRLDKFLKNSRLIKRRAVAKEACDNGRVEINGKSAKAGSIVKEGDIITINYGTAPLSVLVTSLTESSKKETAKTMYEEVKREGNI